MARPKEFDQDLALRQAVRLFSLQGFAATSTEELLRSMGINRQSMYDTFGDKHALFLKALELYVTESVQATVAELEKPGSPLAAVTNALLTFAGRKDMASAEGCMGINAIGEFGQRDAGVLRISGSAGHLLHKALLRALQRAKEEGEVEAEFDVHAAAEFFQTILAGLRVAAKAGKSRKALRDIATFAGRALTNHHAPLSPPRG
jgi:TetR/AcrR family transcriptional repressor of nem operon